MKRVVRMSLIAIACSGLVSGVGFAQERVRLTLPSGTITGVVTRMSPRELELTLEGGGSRVLSGEDVLQLERSVVHDHAMRGYLLGSLAGFGSGLAAARVFYERNPNGHWWVATPVGLILGGVAGFVVGSKKRQVCEIVPGWAAGGMTAALVVDAGATREGRVGFRVAAKLGF